MKLYEKMADAHVDLPDSVKHQHFGDRAMSRDAYIEGFKAAREMAASAMLMQTLRDGIAPMDIALFLNLGEEEVE